MRTKLACMDEYLWWDKIYKMTADEELPWERGEPRPELVEIVEEKIIKPPDSTLDLGCGLGTQAIYLASKGFNSYGIDFAPTAVERAQLRAETMGLPVNFQVHNVIDLPHSNNTFDFTFDFGCLHHNLESAQGYVSEVERVLKNGGYHFLFAFQSRISDEEIDKLFKDRFKVMFIAETSHKELPTGTVHPFWKALMQKY
jgi:2-polyprenyl-3-methyl-5-hydroxy-6-metoxy-1,4-benzoquinol methylase